VQSIAKDIEEEGVRPEEIIVVWFDAIRSRKFLPLIQQGLLRRGIQSTLPGILHGTADFAEPGRVTLTTAYRAKGNESPVVYLLAADVLHSFAGEIEYRNRAFTSISRSKGWVRIVGSGVKMASLQLEVQAIQADIPYFRFVFPDMEEIRRLDARETTRRRKKVQQARKSVEDLLAIDPGALEDLDPSALAELEVRLRQIRGGQGEAE
jgi:superfamily I DNA and RNA helicase